MEAAFQYAWRYNLYHQEHLVLDDGRCVSILNPGVLNKDAGPDFSFAKVEVDGMVWCGNVEIHVKASDWYRHGHDRDLAYDSVILHVVADNDCVVKRADGTIIPQLKIELLSGVSDTFDAFKEGLDVVKCHKYLQLLSGYEKVSWIETLSIERLQSKAAHVAEMCKNLGGDWQQTCFALVARAMGFGLNSEPMEMLARSLPLNFLARHSDNLFQIEALLFGQSGLLDSSILIFDAYYQELCREYYFLSRKYSLRPMKPSVWKFARTRPQNFPYRRIAALAQLLHGGFTLMSDIIDARGDIDKLESIFEITLTGYWSNRYSFGGEERALAVNMSKMSIHVLMINAVVPLLYAYGILRGDSVMEQSAIDILDALPAEKNSVVKSWYDAGIKASCALESQAVLHLKKQYCDLNRCNECRFGYAFMQRMAKYWNDKSALEGL